MRERGTVGDRSGTELEGRTALITGGTTGLGSAIAEAFLRQGARVAFTGRDPALGAAAETRLGAHGDARFLRADAAEPKAIDASVAEALAQLGRLDVLVNSAGIGVEATALATPMEDFDRVMAVNVRAALRYAQACFPHLEERRGSMIHIGSDAGILGEVEIAVYSVSKAALHMLSNVLAIEGGPRGVRSNVIAPGDIQPGMRHLAPPGEDDRVADDTSTWLRPPIGRIGDAFDVAEAAVYLASDRASFVNGAVLTVDGGMRAGFLTAGPATTTLD
jgi:meso-butanediol dehydrogenase/(S,S)-butanediol dehydrogenase/diacetyl reductase